MKSIMQKLIITLCVVIAFSLNLYAQKVGFMSSDMIRNNFSEAKSSEQRVQSIVDEWKRELASMQVQIDNLEFEIRKNRLIWTDNERAAKEKELRDLTKLREAFAKVKFEPNGEYDNIIKEVMRPVETKIYAAVQEVAASEGYDIIWDQSTQPLSYVNFKYDITVKVLRKLGVDVSKLEKEQEEKIKADPRNEEKETKRPRRRSRTQRDSSAPTLDEPTNDLPDDDIPEDRKEKEREFERKR